jgi:hypothetical protein
MKDSKVETKGVASFRACCLVTVRDRPSALNTERQCAIRGGIVRQKWLCCAETQTHAQHVVLMLS